MSKNCMRKILFALALFLIVALIMPRIQSSVHAQAQAAVFVLSPIRENLSFNNSFPVELFVDTNSNVLSVKATLVFDSELLEVVRIDSMKSSFPYRLEEEFNNSIGTISIQRSSPTPNVGRNLVATIVFRTKSAPGTASLDYEANCFSLSNPTCLALKAGNTNILTSSTAGYFEITSFVPTEQIMIQSTTNYSGDVSDAALIFVVLLVIGGMTVTTAGMVIYVVRNRKSEAHHHHKK